MKVNSKESLLTQKLLLGKEVWKYFDSIIDHLFFKRDKDQRKQICEGKCASFSL